MARDVELDRLKTEQDFAYTSMQTAFESRNEAWQARDDARDAYKKALDARQRAYEEQSASWEALSDVHSVKNPRIEELKILQETSFQSMKLAFANAETANEKGDGVAANAYAQEARSHRKEMHQHVARIRQLREEIQTVRKRHDTARQSFESAKTACELVKLTLKQAEVRQISSQTTARETKSSFNQAIVAFKNRLAKVSADAEKRRSDK